MKCVVCKHGETRPGSTTLTLERHGGTLVVKGVPARICDNCGEAYVEEETTRPFWSRRVRTFAPGCKSMSAPLQLPRLERAAGVCLVVLLRVRQDELCWAR